jgi:hypothetical protein
MLSKLLPVPLLCLKYAFSRSAHRDPIPDDACLRLVQIVKPRVIGAVGRPSTVLDEVMVSFVLPMEAI